MTKEQIEAKISEKEKELNEVKGTVCEVWARVVGYMRPIFAWNEGKKAEYHDRKMFDESIKK